MQSDPRLRSEPGGAALNPQEPKGSAPPMALGGVHEGAGISTTLTVLLFVAMAATAASLHFHTPMLAVFAAEFDATTAEVGWVATASLVGFVCGIVFLVPLGDRVDKKKLILGRMTGLVVSLVAVSLAPSLGAVIAISFFIGVFASTSQDIIPLTAQLARPEERGRAVGTILSGLMIGILFGRFAGGLITEQWGWRAAFLISAAMLVAQMPVLIRSLPSVPSRATMSYTALIRSVFALMRAEPTLRRASFIQFLLGLTYGGFWATLAQMMQVVHGLGPSAAGAIGIPGAAGVLIARPVGRWVDRRGPVPAVFAGIALVLGAYVAFGIGGIWVAGIVAGAMLLDFGIRAAAVANQSHITGLAPDARSRSNTVFMAHVFSGNALGATLATTAFTLWGWTGVCAMGLVCAGAALVYARSRPFASTKEHS